MHVGSYTGRHTARYKVVQANRIFTSRQPGIHTSIDTHIQVYMQAVIQAGKQTGKHNQQTNRQADK